MIALTRRYVQFALTVILNFSFFFVCCIYIIFGVPLLLYMIDFVAKIIPGCTTGWPFKIHYRPAAHR